MVVRKAFLLQRNACPPHKTVVLVIVWHVYRRLSMDRGSLQPYKVLPPLSGVQVQSTRTRHLARACPSRDRLSGPPNDHVHISTLTVLGGLWGGEGFLGREHASFPRAVRIDVESGDTESFSGVQRTEGDNFRVDRRAEGKEAFFKGFELRAG